MDAQGLGIITYLMMMRLTVLFFACVVAAFAHGQNQLPLPHGTMEQTNEGSDALLGWVNASDANASFTIATSELIPGSSMALTCQIPDLAESDFTATTTSEYAFEVEAGATYTVCFWAKASSAEASLEVRFDQGTDDEQAVTVALATNWKQHCVTFVAGASHEAAVLQLAYLLSNATYWLDEVEAYPGHFISTNAAAFAQTVEGFGGGIKRRTEDLYALDDPIRSQIEAYAFQDLEPNMIRFMVYSDLEPTNDNDDPFYLDADALNWTRYESDPSDAQSLYVAEALAKALSLSTQGFDHIIANCNSAPGWLKTNGSHLGGGTLIEGGEDEYSEFLLSLIQGMQERYGIEVTALSPTNEPDFYVNYASMNTSASELASILINLDSRLEQEGLGEVDLISPACFRVSNPSGSTGTTHFVDSLFLDPLVAEAIDAVATHAYQNPIESTDWAGLRTASAPKPIWMTEYGNLHSESWDMVDAEHHIERLMYGFNHGGMTAYMVHLFYEEHDYAPAGSATGNYGSSALVVWDEANEIILPKRYFVFKHFSTLIKKGYHVVKTGFQEAQNPNDAAFMACSFAAPDGSKQVVQVYNRSALAPFTLKIPEGTQSIEIKVTTNDDAVDFISDAVVDFVPSSYLSLQLEALGMYSIVFDVGNACPADLTGDGQIAVDDLLVFLGDFACLENCTGDIDGDGAVSVADLLVLLGAFGEFCGP